MLAQMVGNSTITHNEIGWFRYTGVSVGWTWGYGPTVVHDVITSFNHIHDIGVLDLGLDFDQVGWSAGCFYVWIRGNEKRAFSLEVTIVPPIKVSSGLPT